MMVGKDDVGDVSRRIDRLPERSQDGRRFVGLQEGDAHVFRNAGGAATTDAIRSLTISQRLLGTDEVILIHHTDCGMLTFKDDEVSAQIEEDTGIRPAFKLEAFSNLEKDVRQSIARIKASPFVPRKYKLRGFVYYLTSGRLSQGAAQAATAKHRL